MAEVGLVCPCLICRVLPFSFDVACSWVPTSQCHVWTLWVSGHLDTSFCHPHICKVGAVCLSGSGCRVNGRAWSPAVSCCPSCSCSQDERTQSLCLSNQLELTSYPSGPFVFPSAFLLAPYYQTLCILQSGRGLPLLSYLHPINIRQVTIPWQAMHQAQGLDPGER